MLPGVAGAQMVRHSLATQLVRHKRPINEVADLLGHRSIGTTAINVEGGATATRRRRVAISRRCARAASQGHWPRETKTTSRRTGRLGYSFQKQAATLRALVQQRAEIERLDGPLTRDMALNFVFSWDGTANGRAVRHGVIRRFCEYLAIYDPRMDEFDPRVPRSRAIPLPRILTDNELGTPMSACRRVSPDYPERAMASTALVGLLACCGLRSGEALRLDRADVDSYRRRPAHPQYRVPG